MKLELYDYEEIEKENAHKIVDFFNEKKLDEIIKFKDDCDFEITAGVEKEDDKNHANAMFSYVAGFDDDDYKIFDYDFIELSQYEKDFFVSLSEKEYRVWIRWEGCLDA